MAEDESASIEPRPDGPYLVRNLKRLSNQKGALEARATMALCRCGESASKPFCDGSHTRIGFSAAKQEGRVPDRQDSYRAGALTIRDNRGLCAHAGRCVESLPAVFRPKQAPWIDPAGASAETIAAAVRKCPSGALGYAIEGETPPAPAAEPAIFVAPDGPYLVTGGPELRDTVPGAGASPEHFTLCRCGASRNKPFCDGSHRRRKFRDARN